MKNKKHYLSFSDIFLLMLLIGGIVTVGQVLVLREFLVIFYGNELAIGVVLSTWLFWGGFGSIVLGRYFVQKSISHVLFPILTIVLSLILPLTILGIRLARNIWHIIPGEIVAPLKMLQMSSLLLIPFCALSGMLFVVANHLAKKRFPEIPVARLYMAEAAGAAAGGILLHWVLLPYCSMIMISELQLLFALFMIASYRAKTRTQLRRSLAFTFLFPIACTAILLFNSTKLDQASRQWQWPLTTMMDSKDSIYNNLVVTKDADQISFFANGLWCFSSKDKQTAEESVHFAMLQHPHPRLVLLLGATFSGETQEVLRYPQIKQVQLVELDPDLVKLAKKRLPDQMTTFLKDPRVNLFLGDARLYVRTHRNIRYDVIIMHFPDPVNLQLNRFYTKEFFEQIKKILQHQGIFSFTVTGAENMLGPDMARFLGSIYWTAKSSFADVVAVPGQTTRFFCCPTRGIITKKPRILTQRLTRLHMKLTFIRPDSIRVVFSPFKVDYLLSLLDTYKTVSTINSDFKPRCYYDDLVLWSKQYETKLAQLFKFISSQRISVVYLVSVFLFVGLFWVPAKLMDKNLPLSPATYLSTATIGFSHMTLEIILLLGFQVFYGFIYRQLALMVAAFMAGLATGTLLGEKKCPWPRHSRINLVFLQGVFLVFLGFLYIVFVRLHAHPTLTDTLPDWFSFPLLAAITGILGGLQFPWAIQVLIHEGVSVEKVAGNLYGYDLGGSAIGCLVASLVVIPLYGILSTLLFLALLHLLTAIFLVGKEFFRPKNL